jgi:lysosomal acid lipase/cholesteryl ester hydrolase
MLFQPPSSQNTPSKAAPKDSDVGLDMMQIVEKRGYSIQSFYATTEDGYILNMFRMEKGESKDLLSLETVQEKINHITSRTSCAKPPVLLQHGLLDSSFTWVSNFPYQSLGYILVDAGYDVWFGNNRGNTYSRNHTTKNPDDGTNDFWAFTWDELALIDVPTMINFVLDNTGCPSINWIGHSEGTIQLFGAGSAINEYPNLKAALDKIVRSIILMTIMDASD